MSLEAEPLPLVDPPLLNRALLRTLCHLPCLLVPVLAFFGRPRLGVAAYAAGLAALALPLTVLERWSTRPERSRLAAGAAALALSALWCAALLPASLYVQTVWSQGSVAAGLQSLPDALSGSLLEPLTLGLIPALCASGVFLCRLQGYSLRSQSLLSGAAASFVAVVLAFLLMLSWPSHHRPRSAGALALTILGWALVAWCLSALVLSAHTFCMALAWRVADRLGERLGLRQATDPAAPAGTP